MIGWGEDGGIVINERMVRQLIQPGSLQFAPTWLLRGALAFMSSRDESADDPQFKKFAEDARVALRGELTRRGEDHGSK